MNAATNRVRNPWDGIIPPHEQEAYRAAGFGRRTGSGSGRRG
jgi:hypothetical protein